MAVSVSAVRGVGVAAGEANAAGLMAGDGATTTGLTTALAATDGAVGGGAVGAVAGATVAAGGAVGTGAGCEHATIALANRARIPAVFARRSNRITSA